MSNAEPSLTEKRTAVDVLSSLDAQEQARQGFAALDALVDAEKQGGRVFDKKLAMSTLTPDAKLVAVAGSHQGEYTTGMPDEELDAWHKSIRFDAFMGQLGIDGGVRRFVSVGVEHYRGSGIEVAMVSSEHAADLSEYDKKLLEKQGQSEKSIRVFRNWWERDKLDNPRTDRPTDEEYEASLQKDYALGEEEARRLEELAAAGVEAFCLHVPQVPSDSPDINGEKLLSFRDVRLEVGFEL